MNANIQEIEFELDRLTKLVIKQQDNLLDVTVALRIAVCAIQGYKDTNPLHEDSVLNRALIRGNKVLKVLK